MYAVTGTSSTHATAASVGVHGQIGQQVGPGLSDGAGAGAGTGAGGGRWPRGFVGVSGCGSVSVSVIGRCPPE